MDDTNTSDTDITRRELLKKGAVLGGALVWATPVVQTIGMRAALAQSTSPSCPVLYCLKAEVDSQGVLGNFTPYGEGRGRGRGNCLNPGADNDCDPNPPQSLLDELNGSITGDSQGFMVTIPGGCTLATNDGTDSPVFFEGSSAVAKCGRDCFAADIGELPEITFNCGNDKEISHVELLICCPEPT